MRMLFRLTVIICCCWSVFALDSDHIDIHGFVSQGFLYSTDNNWVARTSKGTFEFNEVGVTVSADLTDNLRGGLQLFAFDLGPIGNNEVTIDWAFLDYRLRQEFGLRAGRTKYTIGFYNEMQDIDVVRPTVLLPQSVYYTLDFREASVATNGLQFYGNVPMGDGGGDLEYQATLGSASFGNESSVARQIINDQFGILERLDQELLVQGSLIWNTPLNGLRLGISCLNLFDIAAEGQILVPGADGPARAQFEIDNYAIWVVSAEYAYQDLTLTAEYRGLDYREDTVVAIPIGGVILHQQESTRYRSEGYYLQASYAFADAYTASVYGSVFNRDRDDRHSSDSRRTMIDIAASLRWDINPHWNTKAEVHYLDGHAQLKSFDNPDGFTDTWWLFALKTTLSF